MVGLIDPPPFIEILAERQTAVQVETFLEGHDSEDDEARVIVHLLSHHLF